MIPARYNSEEIFCKTLADIGGKPMIQHVHERASRAAGISSVIVVTDHEKIKETVEGFGGKAALTSMGHICGTDRIVEAFKKLDEKPDIVVNVQADEPFMEPAMISEVSQPLVDDPALPMATICCPFGSREDHAYPFNVKVVRALNGNALYFTRAPVPYPRKEGIATPWQHVGIYAYQGWFLGMFPAGPSYLERTESLEQLRVLEHGYSIKVVETKTGYKKIAVNTPEDLEKARRAILEQKKLSMLCDGKGAHFG